MATEDSAALDELSQTSDGLAERLTSIDTLSKSVGTSLTGAFKGAVVQGKSLDTVLRGLVDRLSSKVLDTALAPLTSALGGGVSTLMSGLFGSLGFARGGVFAGGRPTPFADGGIVSTPTYFPLRGGTGLMGEAGAEAIMPLTRGPDGRLGVVAQGSGATTNVTFNVTTPDAASFRRSQAQVTSMLARAVGRGRRGL